jgi:acyl-CoA thioesterase-1
MTLKKIALLMLLGASFSHPYVVLGQVRVMHIGENSTVANFGFATYRYPLWFRLKTAGYDVDFIGQSNLVQKEPEPGFYPFLYDGYDRDHQAFWRVNAETIGATLPDALAVEAPDIAIIMWGWWDLYRDPSAAAVDNVRSETIKAIDLLRQANPSVSVLLASRARAGFEGSSIILNLNLMFRDLAEEMDSPAARVIEVDLHSGYDNETMNYHGEDDDYYPNQLGEEFLAERLFSALESLLQGEQPFTINPGLNDAWYNPLTNGQGFQLAVLPESGIVFLAWFTYDTERPPEDVQAVLGDPGHRWLTAQGPYEGDTANLTIYVTSGGVFDFGQPAAVTDPAGDGTMTLEFSDCANGLVSYEITSLGISGEVPIQRIAPDNIAMCEMLSEQ